MLVDKMAEIDEKVESPAFHLVAKEFNISW